LANPLEKQVCYFAKRVSFRWGKAKHLSLQRNIAFLSGADFALLK